MSAFKRTISFILDHPLGKKHPLRAVSRLILWQVQLRLYPNRMLVKRFVGHVNFFAKRGLTGVTANIYTGLHEFFDMMFMLHLLRKDDVFFDIGANVGSYTLLASGISEVKSVSLEPVESTFDMLRSNIELNALQDKVELINAGAGGEAGTLEFSIDEGTSNHVITGRQDNNNVALPVITIDSLVEKYRPILVKIDVEGFETEVLRGMSITLDLPELKAIIIELNGSGSRYGFKDTDIHNLMLEKGFKAYYYEPYKRQLAVAPSYGTHNTIYCRDLEFIRKRVEKATAIKIMGDCI
jgi:FkbM family methyltransferase